MIILVIILAVYRRRRHVFGDKDMDCDIRENIINYEDEGGGEGDQVRTIEQKRRISSKKYSKNSFFSFAKKKNVNTSYLFPVVNES